ncbi:MAG: NADH-quinone oxidoreductase subunit K [Rubrivivax sp.]|nr:NADH-quinone oxidoreductase subunit K [Rubrivivax sp.]
MSAGLLYAFAGAALLALGLYALVVHGHLLRKILAVNVVGSGVFLVLVGLAQRDGAADPVPQAMVLTGIVVAVSATALALVLMRRLFDLTGATALDETD